jgi:hypothetical protein
MKTPAHLLRGLLGLALLQSLLTAVIAPARAGITPLVSGDGPNDSVRIALSVNDTLGNAADADTIVLIWSHKGIVFDSIVTTAPGYRTGPYIFVHPASDNGALGDYQVLTRARVQGRTPITNYTYQVVKGGLMPLATITDSNLARAVMADSYKADLTPCGSGNGAIPCTLFVVTAVGGDTVALQGVFLRVYNSSETATAAAGTSDANGRTIFTLEETDYLVYAYQSGYEFSPLPETVTVGTDGTTDTLWGAAFDPGSPATADLCRVYGWVYNLSGDTLNGATVNARVIQSPLRFQNVVVSPYKLTTTTDSTGYWRLDLFPSASLTPDTTRYEFTIRFASGAILRRKVAVPDSAQWLLSW